LSPSVRRTLFFGDFWGLWGGFCSSLDT
jgi:hypothetical protein